MRVLAVCHDAGGAELVSAWLRRAPGVRAVAVVGGPAAGIFARKLPSIGRAAPFPPLAGCFDLVVCGSSGEADLERRAVRAAGAAGVRSAVWLDHWTGFARRFAGGSGTVLPDEVWVADEHAARLAAAALPGADVRVQGNPYLEDMVAEVRAQEARHAAERAVAVRGVRPERILYVTEPTSTGAARLTGDPLGLGYEERAALAGYLEHLAAAPVPPAAVRLRPHPAEPPGKYDGTFAAFAARLPLERSPGGPLAADVAWADTVAGCDSMAMVVALHAGRRVVCAIPPGGRGPAIPFAGVERVF